MTSISQLDDRTPVLRIDLSQPLPTRRSDLIIQEVGQELLVYVPAARVAHRLDALAALVYRHCDGRTPIKEIVARLARRTEVEDPEATLRTILQELVDKGIVEPPQDLSVLGWVTSRRGLLANGSRLALALPFVTSVLAPGPAAAVSLAPGMAPTLAHYDDLESMEGIYNTEGYDYLAENPFREVALHPVSTLGADVDTASYANVRRFLNQGQLPPVGAVRIEEMLNYFHYDDPLPVSEHPLALCAELSTCPWNPTHQLLRLGLQTSPLDPGDLPPCNLVFLIDVSGSMAAPNKLPLVKSSMQRLVQSLGPRDRVAIAVYAGASGLVLDSTPADRITEILTTLDCLEAAGSTHGAAGLELAYRVAERAYLPGGNNRVILATDGDFNVGSTSRDALVRLIERKRQSGIFLSVLGFGQGNLKDSTMEQLAAHGNGNYAYIDSLSEARKVLVAEAGATLFTVARDVKLQLEWNPVQVRAYRLLGYENRVLAREDFADDTKDSAEIGAGHHVTVLYELIAGSVASGVETSRYWGSPQLSAAAHGGELGILKVRYKRPQSDDSRELTLTLDRSRVEHSEGATSDEFRLAAAVATFGLLLRDSKYRGEATYRLAEELAVSTLRGDHAGYRAQLLELIRTAQHLDDVTL